MKPVEIGDKAPFFTLQDAKDNTYSLEESIRMGKKIVLFFYPKGSFLAYLSDSIIIEVCVCVSS